MADTKITALTAITTVDPAVDVLPIVDVSDTSMAASGTTKKITSNQILGAGGTATLASATVTGNATAAAFIPSGSTVPTNGTYLPSANTVGWAVNSTNAMTLNSTGLGVGVSPGSAIGNLQVGGSSNANLYVQQGTDTIRMGVRASGRTGIILDSSNATYTNRAWYLDNAGSSGSLVIGRQGLDVITFDNSGNVGIGVTPSASSACVNMELGGYGATISARNTSSAAQFAISSNAVGNWYAPTYKINGYATQYAQQGFNGTHAWYIAPSGTAGNPISGANAFVQAMTLDASGNLLVGVTSTTTPGVGNTTAGGSLNANGAAFFSNASSQALYLNTNVDGQIVSIRRSNVSVGSISVTTTATAYNTSSDYRLKEAVQPLVGGLARVSALKPSIYKWKADGSNGEGFIAHELAEVVPLAVTGEKDAVNEDGSIKAQGVDLSKVVPVLVAAIQELSARVQTLETR